MVTRILQRFARPRIMGLDFQAVFGQDGVIQFRSEDRVTFFPGIACLLNMMSQIGHGGSQFSESIFDFYARGAWHDPMLGSLGGDSILCTNGTKSDSSSCHTLNQ